MPAQQIIWRDDDLGYAHTAHAGEIEMDSERIFNDFVKVDQLFIKYGVKHTVAVIAKDVEKSINLIEYVKAHKHIDVQLHCWEHLHYPQHMDVFSSHIEKGINKLTEVFGKRPTVFYPPYNDVCVEMRPICKQQGLELSYLKMDLIGYLKGRKVPVINFHYWADECKDLEEALKKYMGK